MEAIRKTLTWRKDNIWPKETIPYLPQIHCFPDGVRDPLGRPILLIQVISFLDNPSIYQPLVMRAFEQLRLHLSQLRDQRGHKPPALQYVVLLDLKELAISTFVQSPLFYESLHNLTLRFQSIDLITWFAREVIPRFPGMIAAGTLFFRS
jgi:retinaldehyde-binding protein 1